MDWLRKLKGFAGRRTLDAELEEELRSHLEMKLEAANDPAAARRQFGNTTLHLEDSREQWRWPRLDAWARDFRYALRVVRRKPGFAATVALTLALAIGSASTIYSLIDAVVIRALPYPDPGRLVAFFETRGGDELNRTPVSPGRLEDWQRLTSSFENLAGSYRDMLTETTADVPQRISAAVVSPRFFSTLGTPPAIGRIFTADEERAGGPPAVILSDAIWRRRFGADLSAVGRTLAFSGERFVIVGVMPPAFVYPEASIEVWIPKRARPELMKIREARFYAGVGRLRPGVTTAQAKTDLDGAIRRLAEQYPKTDAGWSAAVEPLKDRIVGRTRSALWLLTAAVTVLLLIGCANVACLLLSRLHARAAEIATRRSLGAGRAALARQLLAEGLVYALAGGGLGLAGAYGGVAYLRNRLPDVPRISELRVDARMLALVMATTLAAAVLFSLAPILQTMRRDLAEGWIRGGRGVVGTRQRLPRFLVAAQFAMATALLISAGLFLRSLARLEETPLGFRSAGVYTFHLGATFSEAPDFTMRRHARILEALTQSPDVSSAAMSAGLPAVNSVFLREFQVDGRSSPDGSIQFTAWRMVTAGYFETLRIPILAGRTCRMNTGNERPFEALVNRSFADRYLPGRDPVGHTISQGPQGNITTPIVGVVADVREEGHNRPPVPVVYGCGYLRYWPDSDIVVATRSHSAALMAAIKADPASPVYGSRMLDAALYMSLDQTRVRTMLVTLFSTLALTLAAIGLYGVMAYAVSQRSREIGIRLALGARRSRILVDVLRSGAFLAACGAVAGIAMGAAAARLAGTLLYGVDALDVASYAGAIAILFAVAVVACLIPARRAVSIAPVEALRES